MILKGLEMRRRQDQPPGSAGGGSSQGDFEEQQRRMMKRIIQERKKRKMPKPEDLERLLEENKGTLDSPAPLPELRELPKTLDVPEDKPNNDSGK